MGWILRLTIRTLERLQRFASVSRTKHLHTGRRGETEAYLFLYERGYRIVATNYRAPHERGEIDLIAWDGDVLCFIEVKTRVGHGLTSPEAAVDAAKRKHIRSVARAYLRRLGHDRRPHCRFDIVSVTFLDGSDPELRLTKGAFRWQARQWQDYAAYRTPAPRGRWTPRL
jgi:putative endonuclease